MTTAAQHTSDASSKRRSRRARQRRVYVSYCHPEEVRYRDLMLAWDAQTAIKFVCSLVSPLHAIPSRDPRVIQGVLLKAMAGADCLLVIVGPTTQRNKWVNWELRAAREQGIPIVAVKLRRTYRGPMSLYGAKAKFVNTFTRDEILTALCST